MLDIRTAMAEENYLRYIPSDYISAAERTLPDPATDTEICREVVIDVPDRFKVRVRFKRIHFVAGPAARASREIRHHKLFNLLGYSFVPSKLNAVQRFAISRRHNSEAATCAAWTSNWRRCAIAGAPGRYPLKEKLSTGGTSDP
jgi:hypothetical protein